MQRQPRRHDGCPGPAEHGGGGVRHRTCAHERAVVQCVREEWLECRWVVCGDFEPFRSPDSEVQPPLRLQCPHRHSPASVENACRVLEESPDGQARVPVHDGWPSSQPLNLVSLPCLVSPQIDQQPRHDELEYGEGHDVQNVRGDGKPPKARSPPHERGQQAGIQNVDRVERVGRPREGRWRGRVESDGEQ